MNALTFTPAANFNGSTSFTFAVRDNGGTANGGSDLSSTATVNITVNSVEDAPVNTVPTSVSVNEDGNVTIGSISVTDADNNLANVTLTVTSGKLNLTGANVTIAGDNTSSIVISGDEANINLALDNLLYTPAANFNGSVTLTVTSSDGTLTDIDTVPITVVSVNDAPTTANGTLTVAEDQLGAVVPTATFSFSDVDGNALQSVVIQTLPANGTLRLGGVAVTAGQEISKSTLDGNALTFTPAANFNGSTSFTFAVRDNGGTANGGSDLSSTATVNITVNSVEDAPVNTVPTSVSVNEDGNVTIGSISVTDADNNLANVTLTVTSGKLNLSDSNVTITGDNTSSIVISGDEANINLALDNLLYTPAANFNGSVT